METKKYVICMTNIDQKDGYVDINLTVGKIYYVQQLHNDKFPEHNELYMFWNDIGRLTFCSKNQFRDAIKETRKEKLLQLNDRTR